MPRLFIATNGLSVWTSDDLGETLRRASTDAGLYTGTQVWGLAYHPSNSGEMMCGTELGIHRFDPKKQYWSRLPFEMKGRTHVTAIAYSPHDPSVILAGTQPANLYRSEDDGRTWVDLQTSMVDAVSLIFIDNGPSKSPTVKITPCAAEDPHKQWTRVTQIVWDREDPSFVCAGVEIDEAWISRNGGRTFKRSNKGLEMADVHGLAIVHNGGRKLFATTALGLNTSSDDGASWKFEKLDSLWQYTRSIIERPDRAGVMFMTNGSGAPGWQGRLQRSRDYGKTWEDARLPGPVESSLYFLAANPADPNLWFAASALGQFYRSTDGGENWVALPLRLGEVRGIAWVPN